MEQMQEQNENANQTNANSKTGQDQGFVVFEYLADNGMRRQKNEAAARVRQRDRNPKGEAWGKKSHPITPPSKVVDSTARTRKMIPLAPNPAPRNNAPSASPSGILCTQTARMIEKSTIRPDAVEVASAWLPAEMPKPSTVQWMASASIMAEAISLNRWVVASSKWLAAQAGQTWKIYLLMREKTA